MANRTITLKAQVIDYFGPSPSTKWNSFKWTASGVGPGNGTWGMKSAACQGTSSINKALFRTLLNTSQTLGISCPAGSVFSAQNHVRTYTLNVSYSNFSKYVTDGSPLNYTYVYAGPVTDLEHQNRTSYSEQNSSQPTYTSQALVSTSWS